MNLLTPWSLLWLAPLAAAIIFLYLLKLKRRAFVVSSVMLWNRLLADIQANAPFQKLRRNLLLFLQLLALLFIVGALARPFMRAKGFEGQSVVLVFDASGSMKAADVAGTRFGAAKRIARKAVDDLGRGDTMMVIAASAKTRVASPFTSDKRALMAAINSLECRDTATHLGDALRLADSLCAQKKSAQIVVLSDGAFAPLTEPVRSRAKVSFIRVGRRGDNVAVTALDARRSLAGAGGYEVFVATQNFSAREKTFTVELSRDGDLLDAREQTLPPGAQGAEVFRIAEAAAGMITARLDVADDLVADNSASVFAAARRRASVLLLTKGNLFLERALSLDPALDVFKAGAPPGKPASYDLVVVDGVEAGALPRANGYLFINAEGSMAPVKVAGTISGPTIVDWTRGHPVTRYVDFSGVRISQARAASLKPWGHALAETQAGPLVAAGERGGVRSVYVGWDLLESDFPLRVAFPIFMANCVDWLAQPSATGEKTSFRCGEVVSFAVPANVKSVRITGPSRQAIDLPVERSPLLIEDTESAGIYEVKAEVFRRRFAVNMLSREESNTKPADQVSLGGAGITGSAGAVRMNKELWRWLIILALAVVTLEWAAYHRRP
jgi:hypothetical protein